MGLSFIRDMVHPDVNYSPQVVKFFLHALINDSIGVRKIALKVCMFILMQNKPKFKKIEIDPYSFCGHNNHDRILAPGIRSDNQWLLYNSTTIPKTAEEWDKPRYLHRRDFGYYAWPKPLKIYAPAGEQPCLKSRNDNLSEQEKEIFSFFNNEANVEALIKYLSMEEKKGRDQFNAYRFVLFKVISLLL